MTERTIVVAKVEDGFGVFLKTDDGLVLIDGYYYVRRIADRVARHYRRQPRQTERAIEERRSA